jgi:oligopeptide transport system permease protein
VTYKKLHQLVRKERDRLRRIVKWGMLGFFTVFGVFLLCNVNHVITGQEPNLLRMIISTDTSMQDVAFTLELQPEKVVVQEDKLGGIIRVPAGQVELYVGKALGNERVIRVYPAFMQPPKFSFDAYAAAVKDVVNQYLHGNFGTLTTRSGHGSIPMKEALQDMLSRTARYFIPAMLLAIGSAVFLSVVASMSRRTGRVLDGVHALMIALPDFLLIIFVVFAAIYLYKITGKRMILVAQFGDQVPFMIPFLGIALTPGVLIYGTLRAAIGREMLEPYVTVARSKGLSRLHIVVFHVLRNVMEDLFTILPKATTLALASMAVAEAVCDILGLGGVIVSPRMRGVSALPISCITLAVISILFHALYAFLHKRWTVRTREAG